MSKIIQIVCVLSLLYNGAHAQQFKLKLNHADGIYQNDEPIVVNVLTNHWNRDTLVVKVWKNNNQLYSKISFIPSSDSCTVFSGRMSEPCALRIEAERKNDKQLIGLIVDPLKIKPGLPRPDDFEQYWKKEKQALKSLKMNVKSDKADSKETGILCFDTEINCLGPKPARGYFARPASAKVKSLPIVLLVHAAGVKGYWCRSEISNAVAYAKKGALCFDLNAHGMLNGQPDEYYNNLETGELKDYYFKGLENRNDFYFRGMYLRLIRTLDYLTRLPEWDGKRIIVIGESQGGGQALAAAGLDQRVSAVVATVPAMCDWGGTLAKRKGGWPQPFEQKGDLEKMKKVMPYFDTASLLKSSKATIVVEIGLVDQTCPSTSIYAAINQAKGKKIVYPVIYREHTWPTEQQRKEWDIKVFNPKNKFIDDFLK